MILPFRRTPHPRCFAKINFLVKISELTVMLAGKLDPVILVISNFLNVYFDCSLYKLQNENEVLF